MKNHLLALFVLLLPALLFGCGGGGGAFGLIGLAAENAFDTDDTPVPAGNTLDATTVTVQGNVEVLGGLAPGIGPAPSRAFASNADPIEVWTSLDARTFGLAGTGVVADGKYTVTGAFRARYLRIRHVPTGHAMFLGRVSNDALAVAVPVEFNTMAVILTKVLEKQGALATLVCGSPSHTTLRDAAEQRVKATINNDLRLALAAIPADGANLTAAALGLDLATQGFKDLLTANAWTLGTLEVAGTAREQILTLYSNNLFTFNLVGTDTVYLTGSFTVGTDSAELTVTQVSAGFPVGASPLTGMDQVGEKFALRGVSIYSRERLAALLDGRPVTMIKHVPR